MNTLAKNSLSNELMLEDDFEFSGDMKLRFYASDIMEKLGCQTEEEMEESINRVLQVCRSLQIPLKKNVKRIYRFDGSTMNKDWKISSLGCYLLMINGNPCNPNVAKAQLFFATQKHPVNSDR